jgi:tetratricopeptide (TPR) repeat protein
MYQSRDAAFADFSAVLSIEGASSEVRACALNNRADIFFDVGDLEAAIADRTAVLELSETTYDRRYIARIRRCRAYLQLGRESDALADLEAILATDDIVVEQKMTARLKRAGIWQQSRPVDARGDLSIVIASPVNFPGVVPEALVVRGYISLQEDDLGRAIEDLNAALSRPDLKPDDLLKANFGLGLAFAELGEHELAREALTPVAEHPEASEHARSQAEALLESLTD